ADGSGDVASHGGDLFARRTRHVNSLDNEATGQFTHPEDLYRHPFLSRKPLCDKGFRCHGVPVGKPVEIGHIDYLEYFLERVVGEASARNSPEQGHLPALESETDTAARAGLLAFRSLAGGFPVAGPDSPPEPLVLLLAFRRADIETFHNQLISSTSSRYETARTIPRMAGEAECSTTAFILRRPSAF